MADEERRNHPACASCKYQRKKCTSDCILIHHFPANRMDEFKAVKEVFGIKSLTKMISDVNFHERGEVVKSLCWEAAMWAKDPVHGPYRFFKCVEDELNRYKEYQYKLQHMSSVPLNASNTIYGNMIMNGSSIVGSSFVNNYGGVLSPYSYRPINGPKLSLEEDRSKFLTNEQLGYGATGSSNVRVDINNNNASYATDQKISVGELSRGQVSGDFGSRSNGVNHATNQHHATNDGLYNEDFSGPYL